MQLPARGIVSMSATPVATRNSSSREGFGLHPHPKIRGLLRFLRASRWNPQDAASHLRGVLGWLCRAQDATRGGGVSYGYGILEGWRPAYPETTGYCIPTCLRAARLLNDASLRERALTMAAWELTVQTLDGGIPGGPLSSNGRKPCVPFDTGQVLQGWIAAFAETRDPRFLCAARRAGAWLTNPRIHAGIWQDEFPAGRVLRRAYNARTCWALLQLHQIDPQPEFRQVAYQNLEWTLDRQLPNGWLRENTFVPGHPALTHCIAYVMEGLMESSLLLQELRLLEAAVRTAQALKNEFDRRGWLPARFDSNWKSSDRFSCVTGNAQTALVWLRLYEITGRQDFREAGLRMNEWLKGIQIQSIADPNLHGGMPGSSPIYGSYEPVRLPNWAAKFFADALLAECELKPEAEVDQKSS